jgi:hypothetical protein
MIVLMDLVGLMSVEAFCMRKKDPEHDAPSEKQVSVTVKKNEKLFENNDVKYGPSHKNVHT